VSNAASQFSEAVVNKSWIKCRTIDEKVWIKKFLHLEHQAFNRTINRENKI